MILLSVYEVAEGTRRLVAFEDVVVAAWGLFPQEFGLRGYTETHPDSSELHRHLYGALERERLVCVQRNRLALTESGLAAAERMHERDCAEAVALDPSSTSGASRWSVDRRAVWRSRLAGSERSGQDRRAFSRPG
jgi:hypothetical protein